MAVLPKYQLKQLFEKGDLITQDSMYEFIEAAYNPTLIAGSNIVLSRVETPSGTTITISSIASGGGGSDLTVTDGTTAVSSVDTISFTGDVSVSDLGNGDARVTITGGGDTVSAGDGIDVTTVVGGKEISINLDTSQTNLIINGSGELTFEGVHIQDEGAAVGTYKTINFIGDDVLAEDSGTPGKVNVYVPTPTFASHFNTTDGTTTGTVSEGGITRSTLRISSPTTEGNPFKTNGWAGTNRPSYTGSSAGTVVFTTAQVITGFSGDASGDATITVTVYDADGTSVLETYTTPTLYQNATHNSTGGRISVTVSQYAADTSKWKGAVSISVQAGNVLSSNSLTGGRYHVEAVMNTDTATDGGGTYTYTQNDVFFDTNPSTPAINGTVTISESSLSSNILTKHLSGVEYYILNSEFEIGVNDIDNLNANTQGRASAASWNLRILGTDYGLPQRQLEAWNLSYGTWNGTWTNLYNLLNANYEYDSWPITNTNFRYRGASANSTGTVYDPWSSGNTVSSANAKILVDTYGSTSSKLRERFDDEDERLERTGSYTSFDSTAQLTSSGLANQTGPSGPFCQACVVGGSLVRPDQFFLTDPNTSTLVGSDLPNYKPDKNGTNPDYSTSGYQVTATYHRLFEVSTSNLGRNISSFDITFNGTFPGGDAYTALLNEDMKIYIRKSNANSAISTNIGYAAVPHSLHGNAYSSGAYADPPTGVDASDGSAQCRTGTTPSNTVSGTFGTAAAQDGFYVEVQILDSSIKINGMSAEVYFSSGTPTSESGGSI